MAIEIADKLYTSTQVADILGVSLRTLYRYMEDGKIQSMRTASGRHRFTKQQILDFLNASGGDYMRDSMDEAPAQRGNQFQSQPYQPQYAQNPDQGQRPQDQWQPNQGQQFSVPGQQGQSGQTQQYGYGQQQTRQYDQRDFDTLSQGQRNPQDQNQSQAWSQQPGQSQGFQGNENRQNQQPQPYARMDSTGFPSQVDFNDSEDDLEDDEFQTDDQPIQPGMGNQSNPDSNVRQPSYSVDEWDDFSAYRRRESTFDQMDNQVQQPAVEATSPVVEQRPPAAAPSEYSMQVSRSAEVRYQQQQQPQPQAARFDQVEETDENISAPAGNIRYYKSDYTDLIELAKKIKQTGDSKDLEYAFTMDAGLSLHKLIRPFTILHFYANPEDMQIWKDELKLVPTQRKEEANIGVVVNTDIVFVSTKEIGGFRVVEDKILLRDLSNAREESLVKEFREYLTSS